MPWESRPLIQRGEKKSVFLSVCRDPNSTVRITCGILLFCIVSLNLPPFHLITSCRMPLQNRGNKSNAMLMEELVGGA